MWHVLAEYSKDCKNIRFKVGSSIPNTYQIKTNLIHVFTCRLQDSAGGGAIFVVGITVWHVLNTAQFADIGLRSNILVAHPFYNAYYTE